MYLEKILKDKSISKLKLAYETQIAPSDLYSAFKKNKPFYPAWRKRIASHLQINEEILFEDI